MEKEQYFWGLLLILGYPTCSLLLSELIDRLDKTNHLVTPSLKNLKTYVLPLFTLLWIFQHLLQIDEKSLVISITKTILGIAVAYTMLGIINVLLTSRTKVEKWQISVPNLLFQFSRTSIVLGTLGYILANVWLLDLSKVMGALGVGSLVMALALQDTLSNLVSGFLLIIESPFKVGDWIRIKEIEGEVIEINWRAVRLKTRDRDVVIIPNGVLGGETVSNYTLFDPLHAERIFIEFAKDNPPNKIKRVLLETALKIPGIIDQPPPEIRTKLYNLTSIQYEMKYYLSDYPGSDRIRDMLMTQIYYAIKRNHLQLAIPFNVQYEGSMDELYDNNSESFIENSLYHFVTLLGLDRNLVKDLKKGCSTVYFGKGEEIIHEGEIHTSFYLIIDGVVSLNTINSQGQCQSITHLIKHDCFGEMAFLGREKSPVSVIVTEDISAVKISQSTLLDLIQKHPKFALQMNQFIEDRKTIIRQVKETLVNHQQQISHHPDEADSFWDTLFS